MPPTTSSDSFVGPDLVLEGTITGEGNLRVAGQVKGTLAVDGDVRIEPGAHMRGSVEFGWAQE